MSDPHRTAEPPVRAPRLHPGDRVTVIAPAGPVPKEEFLAGLAILRQRYVVEYDEEIFMRSGFLAGDDARRRGELDRALASSESKALFCARGGYGVLRLLPELSAACKALQARPKLLVGFSDITALLVWAVDRAGVVAIHGPVVTQLGALPSADLEHLWPLLEGTGPELRLSGLRPVCPGRAAGLLFGGNLEVLTRLIGTPWQPRLRRRVLLLEEVGERPYRIDRMLTHLRLAGALDDLAAIVLGELVRCEEPATAWPGHPSPTAEAVVAERLAPLGIPVLAGLPVGHGTRNLALPLGVLATVDADQGTLEVAVPAVA